MSVAGVGVVAGVDGWEGGGTGGWGVVVPGRSFPAKAAARISVTCLTNALKSSTGGVDSVGDVAAGGVCDVGSGGEPAAGGASGSSRNDCFCSID